MNMQTKILNFKKPEANTEPIIYSEYWGDTFPITDLLEALEKAKKNENN